MISKAGVVLLTLALTVLQTTALSWLGGHMPVLTGPKRVTVNTSPLNKSQVPLLLTPGCLKCSILFLCVRRAGLDARPSLEFCLCCCLSRLCVSTWLGCAESLMKRRAFSPWWFELSVTRSFVPLPCKSLPSALEGGGEGIMCVRVSVDGDYVRCVCVKFACLVFMFCVEWLCW